MLTKDFAETRSHAAALEADGYDGIWVAEANHDPFLRVLTAAGATTDVALGTAVAIALARSPMTTALTAYDLARLSGGRFVLGLGSQVRAHIERRYSMPWSRPAARMREYVQALRAIWSCWQDGGPLDFAGEFYSHTLMTDFFRPEPHEFGPPQVYLAAVGARMTEVAAETCDGVFIHPFTTSGYLREVTVPAVEAGRAASALAPSAEFRLAATVMFCTGSDEAELEASIAAGRRQLAFYASTPAYLPVLQHAGWADVHPRLRTLVARGEWDEMAALVPDDMLDAFSPVGSPAQVAEALAARWSGLDPRLILYPCGEISAECLSSVRDALQAAVYG